MTKAMTNTLTPEPTAALTAYGKTLTSVPKVFKYTRLGYDDLYSVIYPASVRYKSYSVPKGLMTHRELFVRRGKDLWTRVTPEKYWSGTKPVTADSKLTYAELAAKYPNRTVTLDEVNKFLSQYRHAVEVAVSRKATPKEVEMYTKADARLNTRRLEFHRNWLKLVASAEEKRYKVLLKEQEELPKRVKQAADNLCLIAEALSTIESRYASYLGGPV